MCDLGFPSGPFTGVILVLLNLTCTVKDGCEPKCPFLSFKVHRVSFSDNFVQNYRKIQLIQSIFEKFMQPNDRFCCLCAWFQPNWNIMNRVKFGELVVVIVLGQLPAPPTPPPPGHQIWKQKVRFSVLFWK